MFEIEKNCKIDTLNLHVLKFRYFISKVIKDHELWVKFFQIVIWRHNSSDHNDNMQIASLI
jgi:hypothetical protein